MLQILKINVLVLLIFSFFSLIIIPVYANESGSLELKTENINPGSVYYPVKRAWEKISEKLQFGKEGKINFQKSLLDRRLSELKYVVDNNLLNEVQTSSERFAYQAGMLLEDSKEQNSKDNKESVIKKFESYGGLLGELRDRYPANSSFWMLVQHDINTLQILLQEFQNNE